MAGTTGTVPVTSEFWDSYHRIASQVKKRFLRKPNYGEAAVQFAELKQHMKRDGFPAYAAFAALAVARCEQALNRVHAETTQYRDAARLFAAAEYDVQAFVFASDGSTVGFEENYVEALDCYRLAIEHVAGSRGTGRSRGSLNLQNYLHLGNVMLAVELYGELATLQETLDRLDDAIVNRRACIVLQTRHRFAPLQRLNHYKTILNHLLKLRRYAEAIETCREVVRFCLAERALRLPLAPRTQLDVFACEILSAEVLRWLLLMVEGADVDLLRHELARLTGIADFATSDGTQDPAVQQPPPGATVAADADAGVNRTFLISADLADILDALLVASRARDMPTLASLEGLAQPFLTSQQAQLLVTWVDMLQTTL